MHLNDGLLSTTVTVTTGLLALSAASLGLRSRPTEASAAAARGSDVPAGLALGAFVFAAQAGNFPVNAMTSAHVLAGGVLGATIGFRRAILPIACCVASQAALGDGGFLALGANVLNMAIIAPLVAATIMRGSGERRTLTAAVAAAAGVFAAVFACGVELILSGRGPAAGILETLLSSHVPVAAVEGAGAAAVVALTGRQLWRPLSARPALALAGLAALLFIAAHFAATLPDALETLELGFGSATR